MSAVATTDRPVTEAAELVWTRTPEQQALVDAHRQQVKEQYTDLNADPVLVMFLLDETPAGTPEIVEYMSYTRRTRVFQLYSEAAALAAADMVPHPSAIPEPDCFAGNRGARDIRALTMGRFRLWALQSGRKRWHPIRKEIIPQAGINHGGAPRKV